MSTLIWTSPRSSPGPVGLLSSSAIDMAAGGHHHQHPHYTHQVAFGQAAPSPFGQLKSAHSSNWAGVPSTSSNVLAQAGPSAVKAGSAFGFGFGYTAPSPSASPLASTSTASLAFPSGQAANLRHASGLAGGVADSTSPKRRRKRSETPIDEEPSGRRDVSPRAADTAFAVPAASGASKRFRRDIRPIKSMANLRVGGEASGSPASLSPSTDIDVGKAIGERNSRNDLQIILTRPTPAATQSKATLISILSSLLAQQPQLKHNIIALLPPPSLETFTTSLQEHERRVLDALPVGGSTLRQEYVWSRIRTPLEDYISEARLALSQFCPSSSAQTPDDGNLSHPSSTFAFLFTLTQSVRKLEDMLPRAPTPYNGSTSQIYQPSINNPSSLNPRDPLVSFLPVLYNQWHILATRLSSLVNQHGRILSAETVRLWFRQLEQLSAGDVSSASVGRKASEAIRERLIRELGWLIGIRAQMHPLQDTSSPHQPTRAGQVLIKQASDSRMSEDASDEEL